VPDRERSIRERILDALVDLWGGASRPNGLEVYRTPAVLQDDEELNALAVIPEPDNPESETRLDHDDGVECRLTVIAAFRAANVEEGEAWQQADRVFVWLMTQVALDRTLGGLCKDIRRVGMGEYRISHADRTYAAAAERFEVVYHTSEDDPRLAPGESWD
jgi:hypothetical protein